MGVGSCEDATVRTRSSVLTCRCFVRNASIERKIAGRSERSCRSTSSTESVGAMGAHLAPIAAVASTRIKAGGLLCVMASTCLPSRTPRALNAAAQSATAARSDRRLADSS
jgi:hypothetical protein